MWTRDRLLARLRKGGRAARVRRPAEETAVRLPQEHAVKSGYETAVRDAPEKAHRRG